MSSAAERKHSPDYQDLLAKLEQIPTLPVVAMKVSELINDPNSSSAEIADALKTDQALTAKILRLVNSSYYSIPGGVTDVQRALAFLGFNTVAQLVLGLSVVGLFQKKSQGHFSMEGFWQHALGVAVLSEMIGKRVKYPKPEELFTCGLLHDIGKLVMHEIDPERLYSVAKTTFEKQCAFTDVEREFNLPGHSYLGEVMATKWGLPQLICLTVRYHHFDVSKLDTIIHQAKPAIQIVRLANLIAVKNRIGDSGDRSSPEITDDLLAPIKLDRESLAAIESGFTEQFERAGAFINA